MLLLRIPAEGATWSGIQGLCSPRSALRIIPARCELAHSAGLQAGPLSAYRQRKTWRSDMSNRLSAHQFVDRPAAPATRRPRIMLVLVALVCALLAIASVTVGQPKVDAPAIIG